MDDVKLALDKAAASPDPAVRGMALQYIEARNKLSSLEAFFAFYAEGAAAMNGKTATHVIKPSNGAAAAAPVKPRPVSEKAPVKNVKAEDFTKDILDILRQTTVPVKQETLQQAYESLGKEGPLQPETFRQRLIARKNKGDIILIPRSGYRPADESPSDG